MGYKTLRELGMSWSRRISRKQAILPLEFTTFVYKREEDTFLLFGRLISVFQKQI